MTTIKIGHKEFSNVKNLPPGLLKAIVETFTNRVRELQDRIYTQPSPIFQLPKDSVLREAFLQVTADSPKFNFQMAVLKALQTYRQEMMNGETPILNVSDLELLKTALDDQVYLQDQER